jgi:hypothetical protein
VHVVWADQCSSPTFQAIGYREYFDGEWQDMQRLDSSSTSGYLMHHPAVAAGRDSSVAVIWDGDHIYCMRRKSGVWGAMEKVDPNEFSPDDADVAVDPATGNVHVAWYCLDSMQQSAIWHRYYDYATSSWAPIDTISGDDTAAYYPSISATIDGRIAVVWYVGDTNNYYQLRYAERSVGGKWAAPVNLTTGSRYATHPSINADSAGGLYLVWADSLDGYHDVYLRRCEAPFAKDIACTGIAQPEPFVRPGQPIVPVLTIENEGAKAQSNIPVTMWIDSAGTKVYSGHATFTGLLRPGYSARCTMSTQWTPGGSLLAVDNLTAFSSLPGDQGPGDDTFRGTTLTCSWFDDLQGDSCDLRASRGWLWGIPGEFDIKCWGDPLVDTIARLANDSLRSDQLTATIDTPKIAWGSWYYTYPGNPDAGYRLWYSTDSDHTWNLAHAWLPAGRGYDGVLGDGDSAYWGQCPGDSWERMFYQIAVSAGTTFSLCWQYVDLFGAFYPGVLVDYIAAFGFDRPVSVADSKNTPAAAYHLSVVPNPFHGSLRISYSLPRAGNVSIRLYSVTGALVKTLAEGYCAAGVHTYQVDGARLARGVYMLKFASGNYRTTSKLILE